jgi:hypothetical protein
VACDFAITHPLQPSFLADTAAGKLNAHEKYAVAHKTSKYSASVEAEGFGFAPCVLDTFGIWCEAGLVTLSKVCSARAARDGLSAAHHKRLLLQRCAVALMLSNARALLQREDPATLCSDDFEVDLSLGDDDDMVHAPLNSIRACIIPGTGDDPPPTQDQHTRAALEFGVGETSLCQPSLPPPT